MKKTILVLTAALGLTMSAFTARAQYYNFDVTVHQDTDWIAALPILDQQRKQIEQQSIRQFYNEWVYTTNKVQKAVYFNAVPGLRAALAHNDWAAAWSFYMNWLSKEMAYEKRYHACSPGLLAASKAARMQYGKVKN
jgi:hypothetical protein